MRDTDPPIKSIPPLIPLPSSPPDPAEASDDPFVMLTAPASPSSSRTSVFSVPVPSSAVRVASTPRHVTRPKAAPTESPTSEFGSFVSVPAMGDPLHPLSSGSGTSPTTAHAPFTPFFDKFGEEARLRSEMNEKRVMDELRAPEDDPLGWLGSREPESSGSGDVSEEATPSRTASPTPLTKALEEAGTTLIDLSTPLAERSDPVAAPVATRPPLLSALPRTTSDLSAHRPRSHSQTRSRSPTVPSSSSSLGTLSRSWMSSLLSTTRASPARTSSPLPPSPAAFITRLPSATGTAEDEALAGTAGAARDARPGLSPTQSSLHALFAKAQYGQTQSHPFPASASTTAAHVHKHARYATDGLPSTASTMSDSPFAAHPFTPPSGAPGFTGDRRWNPAGFEFDAEDRETVRDVKLLGRKEGTTPVLDGALAKALRLHLPALARLPHNWTLLYSLDQHGISLNSLYARCYVPPGGKAPGSAGALLVLQDAEGGLCGAWLADGVRLSHGAYYGGGDAFLWRTCPDPPVSDKETKVDVYKWTGRNDYVALCDTEFISFGGGDGHYGLYIDANLIEGTTHPCPTFNNACLAQGVEKGHMVAFECVGLEVWGVGP